MVFGGAACVGKELVDDVFHLFEVAHHGVARIFREACEFHFEAQARNGGAQVVRDAGKQELAVGLNAAQGLHHAVEAHVHRLNFNGRSVLGERIRVAALTELRRENGETRERLDHVAREKRRTKERRQACSRCPPEPGRAVRGIEHVVARLQPVVVAVDVKGHPEAFVAVHGTREHRFGSQRRLHELIDEAVITVARNADDFVRFVARRNEDALSCGENFQEVDAVERIDRHERVLREVHRRDDVLRDPLRVRQLREHAKALQPADHRKEDEAA